MEKLHSPSNEKQSTKHFPWIRASLILAIAALSNGCTGNLSTPWGDFNWDTDIEPTSITIKSENHPSQEQSQDSGEIQPISSAAQPSILPSKTLLCQGGYTSESSGYLQAGQVQPFKVKMIAGQHLKLMTRGNVETYVLTPSGNLLEGNTLPESGVYSLDVVAMDNTDYSLSLDVR